jgi:hypothetical protein
MLDRNTSTTRRLRTRRHDVGAELMLRFRPQATPAVSNGRRDFRLRTIDALHAMMLTMICGAAAVILNDDINAHVGSFLNRTPVSSHSAPRLAEQAIAVRIAPAEPESAGTRTPQVVRLSLIEDEPDGRIRSLPASMSAPSSAGDTAAEPTSPASQAVRQPLRAALDLGDQAARARRR